IRSKLRRSTLCVDLRTLNRLDGPHDYPPVLADGPVLGEPQLLVGREGPVEEETGRDCTSRLREALHHTTAPNGDEVQRPGQGLSGDALTAVTPADVKARDPPIRRRRGRRLLVGGPALDPR